MTKVKIIIWNGKQIQIYFHDFCHVWGGRYNYSNMNNKYKSLIIRALDFNRCLTNRELSEITGIDRETLCAPLLGMIDTGLLERDKRKRSPINNRAVYVYRYKDEREQNGCK